MAHDARTSATDVLRDTLAASGLEHDEPTPGTFVVVLPGERKLKTTCSLVVGPHSLSVNAFVVRRPDENHEGVHRWLLERNTKLYAVAFALDHLGDVYLTGRLPLAGVTGAEVDQLLGAVLDAADSSFNTLLELGFASSIRKEWAWRLSRGEPTHNLAAFPHLAPGAASGRLTSMSADTTYTLVLVRHGQSDWNAKNLFTGWVDVGLTETGRAEARRSGELLAERGLLPDVLHTSVLRRAIETAQITLESADRMWLPVRRSWRLNERHYGALQGKDKKQTLAEFGEEQFMLWRRSYDTPPPPLADSDMWSQVGDPAYAAFPDEVVPRTECLADVVVRMLPYWYDGIVPDLRSGQTVLVVAHGNSLRALVKHLDAISDEDIAGLNIPTGIPLVYRLDAELRPVTRGGEYLDADAAAEAIKAVANQGR